MKWYEKSENMAIWRRTSFKWPCLWIFELCLHLWGMLTRNSRHLSIFYWRGSRISRPQISDSKYPVAFSKFPYLAPTNPCTPFSTKLGAETYPSSQSSAYTSFDSFPSHCNTTMKLNGGLQSIAEMLSYCSMKVSSLGMVWAKIRLLALPKRTVVNS